MRLSRCLLLVPLAIAPLTVWSVPMVQAQAPPGAWQPEAPEAARALGRIAQAITVRLEGATSGSGVLVGRDGDQYTVLTAWHVVRDNRRGEEIIVVTPDGRSRPVDASSLRQLAGHDLAILRFRSDLNLSVARLGRPEELEIGSTLAVAGFPSNGAGAGPQPLRLKLGQLEALPMRHQAEGYQLLYSNETLPGMSGGPVLNRLGELVGIHGRAELHAEASLRMGKPIASSTNMGLSIAPYRAMVGALTPAVTPAMPPASTRPDAAAAKADRFIAVLRHASFRQPLQPHQAAGLERLERALAQGQLGRADAITLELLLEEPAQREWLTQESIGRLNCPMLLAIDSAWSLHSRERFGFSVQRRLWPGDFAGFSALAGWRRAGFVHYAGGNESDLPKGYYPRRVADGPILQFLLDRMGRCLAEIPAEPR